jgi:hypothetical protein
VIERKEKIECEEKRERLVTFAGNDQDREPIGKEIVVEMQTNGKDRKKRMTTEKSIIENLDDYKYFK